MNAFEQLYDQQGEDHPATVGATQAANAIDTITRKLDDIALAILIPASEALDQMPHHLRRARTRIRAIAERLTPGHKARVKAAQAIAEQEATTKALQTITAALVAAYGSMAVAALAESILHGKDPHRGQAAGMLFDAITAMAIASTAHGDTTPEPRPYDRAADGLRRLQEALDNSPEGNDGRP